jgi:hypothetical protein
MVPDEAELEWSGESGSGGSGSADDNRTKPIGPRALRERDAELRAKNPLAILAELELPGASPRLVRTRTLGLDGCVIDGACSYDDAEKRGLVLLVLPDGRRMPLFGQVHWVVPAEDGGVGALGFDFDESSIAQAGRALELCLGSAHLTDTAEIVVPAPRAEPPAFLVKTKTMDQIIVDAFAQKA